MKKLKLKMIVNLKINNIDIKICNSTIKLIELTSNIITEELNKGLCIIPGGRTPIKIFNHLSFNESLIKLVKRADEDFDVNDVKNASEYIVYVKAWEFIEDFDLKDVESFDILKKYSSQELLTAFKLAINFFQKLEEYEKCAHLHKIETAMNFFLI